MYQRLNSPSTSGPSPVAHQNFRGGQPLHDSVHRVRTWLDHGHKENYVVVRMALDFVLLILFFFVASARTSTVSRHLCSPLWSKDECNTWVTDHVAQLAPWILFSMLLDFGLLYWVRQGIIQQRAGAYSRLRFVTIAHIYFSIIFIFTLSFMGMSFLAWLSFFFLLFDGYLLRKFWGVSPIGDGRPPVGYEPLPSGVASGAPSPVAQGLGPTAPNDMVLMVPVDASGRPVQGQYARWIPRLALIGPVQPVHPEQQQQQQNRPADDLI